MSAHQEAGKAIERGVARVNGEPVAEAMLPGPSHVARSAPVPMWDVHSTPHPLEVYRFDGRDNEPVIRLVQKRSPNGHIEVGLFSLDELIDVLRAAKVWRDTEGL